eukprot:IDg17265t1
MQQQHGFAVERHKGARTGGTGCLQGVEHRQGLCYSSQQVARCAGDVWEYRQENAQAVLPAEIHTLPKSGDKAGEERAFLAL